jgi:hypothetical protein
MKSKDEKLITVLASGNHGLIALAKSILDDAKIGYYTKNEELEDLIGGGVIGLGYNTVIGPIEIQVLGKNAEEARRLLKDIIEENEK